MEDQSWKQFMETGRIEDYLKFKMKSEEKNVTQEEEVTKRKENRSSRWLY